MGALVSSNCDSEKKIQHLTQLHKYCQIAQRLATINVVNNSDWFGCLTAH